MNKVAVIGLAAIFVSAISTPKIISSQLEQQTLDIVKQVNAIPYYKAELLDANFGWLSSEAKVKVGLDFSSLAAQQPELKDLEALEVVFDIDYSHGPLLASGFNLANFNVSLNSDGITENLNWDKAQPLYQLTAKTDLFGNLSYRDKSPKMSYINSDGLEFMVDAYQGQATSENGQLIHKGVLPLMTFTSPELAMSVTDLVMDTELSQPLTSYFNYDSIPVYSASVMFGNWQFRTANDEPVASLNKLLMTMTSDLDETTRLASGELAYKLNDFAVMGYEGQNLELVMETNNWDEQSYIKLNKMFLMPSEGTDSDTQIDQIISFLQDNLLDILRPNPEFNITSLKGSLPEGDFNANLMAKVENVESTPNTLTDIKFWLSHLNVNSHVEIAKPLFEMVARQIVMSQLVNHPSLADATPEELNQAVEQQTPSFIGMLQAQGTIITKGDIYLLDFELADQQAKLNGNDFPLPL